MRVRGVFFRGFYLQIFLFSWWASAAMQIPCSYIKPESGLKIEVPTPQELQTDRSFWELYETSFPADEKLDPREMIQSQGASGDSSRFWWLTRGNQVLGLAEYIPLDSISSALVGYIAVTRQDQGSGLGSVLLQCMMLETLRRYESSAQGLLLEVDNPEWVPEERRESQKKLVSYYLRRGATILTDNYWLPPLQEGNLKKRMLLMNIPAQTNVAKSWANLYPETIQRIQNAIYQNYYLKHGVSKL